MSELLAVLGSEFLCKRHISHFKGVVSLPIRGFNIQEISRKNRKKNTEIQQDFKNVKNDIHFFHLSKHYLKQACKWIFSDFF